MSKSENRRMQPKEAARAAPVHFVGMFGGASLWDYFAEPQIDWQSNLALAVLFTVGLAAIYMSFKLMPKFS